MCAKSDRRDRGRENFQNCTLMYFKHQVLRMRIASFTFSNTSLTCGAHAECSGMIEISTTPEYSTRFEISIDFQKMK